MVHLLEILREVVYKGLASGQAHVIVGKPEIAVRAPFRAPAVLHNPGTVCRRLMALLEVGGREGVIPSHHGNGVIRRHRLIGVVGENDRILSRKADILVFFFLVLLILPQLLQRVSEVVGGKQGYQLVMIQILQVVEVLIHLVDIQAEADQVLQFIVRELLRLGLSGAELHIVIQQRILCQVFDIAALGDKFLLHLLRRHIRHGFIGVIVDADAVSPQKLHLDGLRRLRNIGVFAVLVDMGGSRQDVGIHELIALAETVLLRKTPVGGLFQRPVIGLIGSKLLLYDADAGREAYRGQEVVAAEIQHIRLFLRRVHALAFLGVLLRLVGLFRQGVGGKPGQMPLGEIHLLAVLFLILLRGHVHAV